MTFTRRKILLKENQKGKMFFNVINRDAIADNTVYELSKEYNNLDEETFMITVYAGKYGLSINKWNKIKLNIIHGRYWLYREREWFVKAIITAGIGFLFGLWGVNKGYNKAIEQFKLMKTDTLPRQK